MNNRESDEQNGVEDRDAPVMGPPKRIISTKRTSVVISRQEIYGPGSQGGGSQRKSLEQVGNSRVKMQQSTSHDENKSIKINNNILSGLSDIE